MSFNPNIKESNVRQFGTTQFQSIASDQRIIAGIYGLPPLSNSRFATAPAAQHAIQVQPLYTTVSQARLVTADWRSDSSRNQEGKYSSQTAKEGSSEKSKPVQFDYQRQYENLLVKYRKKEQKHRTTIKDLKNQLIVKDSLINNFDTQIAAYRNTIDNQKLLTENGQLKKGTEDMEREMNALRHKVKALEMAGDSSQAAKLQQKQAQLTVLRKKIEQLGLKGQGSSIDKLSRDRSYYIERTTSAQKQLKAKEVQINQMEQELNHLNNRLKEQSRELELANNRIAEKTEENRGNWQRLLQLRQAKIKQLELELTKKNEQISHLNEKLEQIPKQINRHVDSLRSEWQKVVQTKDKKLLESDSDRMKAVRQWQEVRLQLQYVEKQLKTKDQKIQEQQNSNFQLTKKLYDLKLQTKAETERVCELRDKRIIELQVEVHNDRQKLEQTLKQLQNTKKQQKKNQNYYEAKLKSETEKRDNSIDSLQKQIQMMCRRELQTKAQLENVILQQVKNLEDLKNEHANQTHNLNKKLVALNAQLAEMKSDLSRSSIQSGYKLQELQKTLKVRQLKIQQIQKDLMLSNQLLSQLRQSSENKQSDHLTKIGQLTRDQMNKQKKINDLELEIKDVSTQLEEAKTLCEQLTSGYRSKSEETTKTHRLHIQMKQKRISELQNSLNDTMEQCKQLKSQIHEATNEITVKDGAIVKLQKDTNAKSIYIENLSKKYSSDMTQRDGAIVEKQSKIRQYEQQLLILKANLNRAEQEAKSFRNQNQVIRTLLRDKDAIIGSSTSRTNQLSQQVKNKNSLLQETLEKLQDLESEHQIVINNSVKSKQDLESKISSLASSLLKAQQDLQAATRDHVDQITKIKQELNQEKIKIVDLQKQITQQRLVHDKQAQDLLTKIAYKQQQLKIKEADIKTSHQTILNLQNTIQQANIQNQQNKGKSLEIEKYKEQTKMLKKQIQTKEQEKISLAEGLLKQRKLSAQLLQNLNSSEASNKSLNEILKSKLQQAESELIQTKQQNRLLLKEHSFLTDNINKQKLKLKKVQEQSDQQIVQLAIKQQQANERILSLQASVQAMQMIIKKLNAVSSASGQTEVRCIELQKTLKVSNNQCRKMEVQLQQLKNVNAMLNEQLQSEKCKREQATQQKIQSDKQTDLAIINIRQQMLELQMNSRVMLEQQQKDIVDYQEKIKNYEIENLRLAGIIKSQQVENDSKSQQTTPRKKEQEQFVRLEDYTRMLEEKQVEIRVLNRQVELYRQKLQALVETGCSPVKSGEEEQKVTISLDSLRLSLDETKVIDYQQRYNSILLSLGIHPEQAVQAILAHIESLVNTHSRYQNSVKQLLQKIDWMQQNLNILNQQNSDYHIELENRDKNMVQLNKTIELKESAISQLRNYESHLTKKLIKLQDLLEQSNKIIINQQLNHLNEKIQAKQRQDAIVATKALLETQVSALKAKMKKMVGSMTTNNESIEISDIDHSIVFEQDQRNSCIFDDKQFEKLKQSEDFTKLKRFFTHLIQEQM